MKVVILAGGLGTRLSEETGTIPKPMLLVGGKPILWHIMKIYSHYGFNDFVILLGYKGYYIKEYFANYYLHQSDITFDLKTGKMEVHSNSSEAWKVTLVETGLHTMTGGRIKKAGAFLAGEAFMLSYGDAVADINIRALYNIHKAQKRQLTLTAVQATSRFGELNIDKDNLVSKFMEKPTVDGKWINGGFMVCQPEILDLLDTDDTIFEREPLEDLVSRRQLTAFKHDGFWQCMDTLRDKVYLNEIWDVGKAKWKLW